MLVRHYYYFKKYTEENNIKSKFWLAENSYHVDGMFKYPDLYAEKMKDFFEENLKYKSRTVCASLYLGRHFSSKKLGYHQTAGKMKTISRRSSEAKKMSYNPTKTRLQSMGEKFNF